MLMRLDPTKKATALHVAPARPQGRDPRLRHRQDQRRLLDRRPQARRARRSAASSDIPINHVVNVNFGGFSRAVNAARLRLHRRRPPLLQRQQPARRRRRRVRDDRHRAGLPAALRHGRARLRPLPPPRHRLRARRPPAGLPAPGEGRSSASGGCSRRPQGARCGSSAATRDGHRLRRARSSGCSSWPSRPTKHPIREVHFPPGSRRQWRLVRDDHRRQRSQKTARSSSNARPPSAARASRRRRTEDRGTSRERQKKRKRASARPRSRRGSWRPRPRPRTSSRDVDEGPAASRSTTPPSALTPATPTSPPTPRALHDPRPRRHAVPAPTGSSSTRARSASTTACRARPGRSPPILDNPGEHDQDPRPRVRAVLRRHPAAAHRLAHDRGRLLGVEHAVADADQQADAATSRGRSTRDRARRHLASLTRLMSEQRNHRRHRHRLRRTRHRRRLRRARQRGLVRRHRRRQDRALEARRDPDLRARPRGARGEEPRAAALLDASSSDALEHARLLFVAVGTPPTYSGDADLSAVHAVVDAMPASDRHALVMKSTVPVGTGAAIKRVFAEQGKEGFRYVSCPEFLKEGSAVKDFLASRPRGRRRRRRLGGRRGRRPLRAARRAARAHRRRLGRDGQAGLQRLPRHEDLVHQRDRERLRGDRRRRPRGRARHGPRRPDRAEVPAGRASASAARASRRTSPRSSSSPATPATTSSC